MTLSSSEAGYGDELPQVFIGLGQLRFAKDPYPGLS